MFQIPSLALRIHPRVWEWAVGQHTLFACSPQHLHTRSQKKKKKTHSLTLLLQNHLDHLNILPLEVVGTSTRAVARAFTSEPPHPKTLSKDAEQHGVQKSLITSTICSGICGTGPSTICCTVRFDIHSSGITLITSKICSWICGTGTAMTIRCTRRACS